MHLFYNQTPIQVTFPCSPKNDAPGDGAGAEGEAEELSLGGCVAAPWEKRGRGVLHPVAFLLQHLEFRSSGYSSSSRCPESFQCLQLGAGKVSRPPPPGCALFWNRTLLQIPIPARPPGWSADHEVTHCEPPLRLHFTNRARGCGGTKLSPGPSAALTEASLYASPARPRCHPE